MDLRKKMVFNIHGVMCWAKGAYFLWYEIPVPQWILDQYPPVIPYDPRQQKDAIDRYLRYLKEQS